MQDWAVSITPKITFRAMEISLELPLKNPSCEYGHLIQSRGCVSFITTEHYTPATAWSQEAKHGEKDSGDEAPQDEKMPPADVSCLQGNSGSTVPPDLDMAATVNSLDDLGPEIVNFCKGLALQEVCFPQ